MTIIGKTGSVFKVAKKTTVWIQPVEGPVVVDNTFLFEEEVGIPTDAAGNFQVTLAMADYWFRVGARRVIVSVDNTTNTYPLEDRIISDVVQLPTQPAGGNQPVASQAVFGIVKGDANVANFIAVSGIFYVADNAAARLTPNAPNNKLIINANTNEIFRWDGISTAADDDTGIYKPNDTLLANPGRWVFMSGPQIVGNGTPEAVQKATRGRTYWDKQNRILYIKDTDSGNAGWLELAAI
jgi:hypothetical protein